MLGATQRECKAQMSKNGGREGISFQVPILQSCSPVALGLPKEGKRLGRAAALSHRPALQSHSLNLSLKLAWLHSQVIWQFKFGSHQATGKGDPSPGMVGSKQAASPAAGLFLDAVIFALLTCSCEKQTGDRGAHNCKMENP